MHADRWSIRTLGAAMTLAMLGCAQPRFVSDVAFRDGSGEERYRRMLQAQQRWEATSRPSPSAAAEEEASLPGHLRQGDRQSSRGDYTGAVWSYLEAHRLDPLHPAPRLRVGFLHLRDDPVRAERVFGALVAEAPDSPAARIGLGLALLAQDRPEQACAPLEAAAQMAPDSVAALVALGVARDRVGQHREAQAQFVRARELAPQDAIILNDLGVSYLATDDLFAAHKVLQEAFRLRPEDSLICNNLGLVLGRRMLYDEALEQFRRCGGEQAAQNNLGWVHQWNGDPRGAVAHYERALLTEGDQTATVLRNLETARAALDRLGWADVAPVSAEPLPPSSPGPPVESPAETGAQQGTSAPDPPEEQPTATSTAGEPPEEQPAPTPTGAEPAPSAVEREDPPTR